MRKDLNQELAALFTYYYLGTDWGTLGTRTEGGDQKTNSFILPVHSLQSHPPVRP